MHLLFSNCYQKQFTILMIRANFALEIMCTDTKQKHINVKTIRSWLSSKKRTIRLLFLRTSIITVEWNRNVYLNDFLMKKKKKHWYQQSTCIIIIVSRKKKMWMLVSIYYLRVMNIYNNDAFIIIMFTFILCEKKNVEHFSFRVNLPIIILHRDYSERDPFP